jgi:hypothetical protein
MDLTEAQAIVEEHTKRQAALEEAQEVIRLAKAREENLRRAKAEEATKESALRKRREEETALQAAVSLLEELEAELTRDLEKLEHSKARDGHSESLLRELRLSLDEVVEGVTRESGCTPRVWTLMSRPEIQRFKLAQPGLVTLRRRLEQLRHQS